MKRKICNAFEDGQIIAAFQQGKRARQIHNELGIPISTLNQKWRRFLERGSLDRLPKSGRPRKTTPREDRRIVRECQRNPFGTPQRIAFNILRHGVSPNTIRRRLRCIAGLKCRKAAKKPLLRKKNIIARLKWAREHQNWSIDQWKAVL